MGELLKIGQMTTEQLGLIEIYYRGPKREIRGKAKVDGKWMTICFHMFPKCASEAIVMLLEKKVAESERFGTFEQDGFATLEYVKKCEANFVERKSESPRWGMYAGGPTASEMIDILQQIIAQRPEAAEYPIWCCGTTWYLHLNEAEKCFVIDDEQLFENVEMNHLFGDVGIYL